MPSQIGRVMRRAGVWLAVVAGSLRYSFGIRQIGKGGLPARTRREDGATLVATALERCSEIKAAHQANDSSKPTPLRGVV